MPLRLTIIAGDWAFDLITGNPVTRWQKVMPRQRGWSSSCFVHLCEKEEEKKKVIASHMRLSRLGNVDRARSTTTRSTNRKSVITIADSPYKDRAASVGARNATVRIYSYTCSKNRQIKTKKLFAIIKSRCWLKAGHRSHASRWIDSMQQCGNLQTAIAQEGDTSSP